ncbi:hypothetical protein MVEN_02153000 [Mycena venus]|uniref:Uncharacterized protein n=1 Tax=Mycena venus TaxID=2733690 RepID=A0A8H7CH34_9AGAR|nr:hypothetical protein MVEN_02153000 [Mycena venus]
MDHLSHTLFPDPHTKLLSALVHLLGITLLTHFLSRRLSAENLTSREAWARISWPRLCILLVLLDSYLFMLSGGLLIFGVGLGRDGLACGAGIYLCVIFYTSSKFLIYAFLTEKVYIVWENGVRPRLKSPVYLICMGTVALYIAVILAMFFGRIAEFRSGDGACVIGLKPTASLPLLAYDLYINALLTSLFLWPLLRVKFANPRLKRVATRTLVASIAALTTSTVNITVLTILHGRELGWLCLGSCGIDVVFNAAALFWVTSGSLASSSTEKDSAERQATPQASIRPGSGISQRSQLKFKPFHLRPKSGLSRPPAQFEIHVTTTSEVETSPPIRHAELEPESPLEEKKNNELPYEPKSQSQAPLEATEDERRYATESKRLSDAESQKTLNV